MKGQIHFNQIHDTMILEDEIRELLSGKGYTEDDIDYVLGIENMRTREAGEVMLELIDRIVNLVKGEF